MSYAFRSGKELNDFHLSDGQHCLRDGTLQLTRSQMAFKYPLIGDITVAVDGQAMEVDSHAPSLALGVAWHQGAGSERAFGLTRTGANFARSSLANALCSPARPFELKPGTLVRYLLTQRGKACVVKIRDGPLLMWPRLRRPAKARCDSSATGCASAYSVLEITGTVPAASLSRMGR